MAVAELRVAPRSVMGKKVKALRRQGIIPGTISGHGVEPTQVQVVEHDLDKFLARHRGMELISLSGLDGQPRSVVVRIVDRVPTSGRVQHIEFQQVSRLERMHAEIPLQFTGTAPAATRDGGTLLTSLNHLRVECLPGDLPPTISVDLGALTDFEAAIHVGDIKAPNGVTILTPADELIAKVIQSRIQEEVEEEQAEAAAATEPATSTEEAASEAEPSTTVSSAAAEGTTES